MTAWPWYLILTLGVFLLLIAAGLWFFRDEEPPPYFLPPERDRFTILEPDPPAPYDWAADWVAERTEP